MNNIILDCDTGEDDALAILVALANVLPITSIITSYGNSTIENATRNTSRLLSFVGHTGIPIIQGSARPMQSHPHEKQVSAGDFVGQNGLCNTSLPPGDVDMIVRPPADQFSDVCVSVIQQISPVDYIITGPCTNFAKISYKLGKNITKYIKNVYIMGGAIATQGNSGPVNKAGNQVAEFNFYCDPLAAQVALSSGVPVYLVPWDVTSTLTLSYERIDSFRPATKTGKVATRIMKNFMKWYGRGHGRNFELNDPVTILAYLGFGRWHTEKISVVQNGLDYGRSVRDVQGSEIHVFDPSPVQKEEIVIQILEDLDLCKKTIALL